MASRLLFEIERRASAALRHAIRAGAVISSFLAAACQPSAFVGTDIFWSADHESGDTSQWTIDGRGGTFHDTGAVVEVTQAHAHRGRYGLRLSASNPSGSDGGSGAGVFRNRGLPADAYYSAFYFIPQSYATNSFWTVMKFESLDPSDGGEVVNSGVDLNLRSLQDGRLVLDVFDHGSMRLLAPPIAYPAPFAPIGSWFQLEVRYRATGDTNGAITVWLDGREVYDLHDRSTVAADALYFMPCNLTLDIDPSPADIFIDDVAISASRVTPSGALP